jgi:hypothetical protein
MLKYIVISFNPLSWILFHFFLGLSSAFTPYLLVFWFYFVFISSIKYLFSSSNIFSFSAFVVYLVSFEMLSRMAFVSPLIPYELGKYFLAFSFILGIIRFSSHSILGILLVALLIPSIFFDYSGQVRTNKVVFNLLGSLNVGLGIWFFSKKVISRKQLISLLRLAVYPLIATASFLFVKSPSFDSIEFDLSANSMVTAGGGSNQVSTILGFGFFLVFIFIFYQWKLTGYKTLDYSLFFMFGFLGILTFSRGGVLGGILAILVVVYLSRFSYSSESQSKVPRKSFKYFLIASMVIILIFQIINNISGGLLTLRYLGETSGTLGGSKEMSLDNFTSGRIEIFLGDLELWFDHLIFGVGVGASALLRPRAQNFLSHVEFSRLIAEHGMLGLFHFALLLFSFFTLLKNNRNSKYKGVLIAFYFLAFYTTFHAAMRTYLTPLLLGMSFLVIKERKVPSSDNLQVSNVSNGPEIVKLPL